METIIVGIIALGLGFLIAKLIEKNRASNTLKNVKEQAATILKEANIEAEGIKKDKILQAKEKFIELKAEHEKVIISRDKKISDAEKRIRDKESMVSQELDKSKRFTRSLEDKEKSLQQRLEFIEKRQSEIEKLHKNQVLQLETISG
ncbi:MAG: Rnase Y domain-containing protein, partial [Lutimonas sp.]